MEEQKQRVVLVTGASLGIGRACAEYLAARGFRVYGGSRSAIPIPGVSMMAMDVTQNASVRRTVADVLQREGRLDVVVNNAGMGIAGPVEATTIEEAQQQFEVNFFGVLRVCREVLPVMRRQRSGYIVNIGSIAGLIALPYQGMYSASKFALEGMCEAMRMEVRPFGIRIVLVEPGDHKSNFTGNRRRCAMAEEADAYRARFEAALAKAAQDEQSGPGPERIARLVHRIVHTANPRLRYTVGPLPQRAAVWLKRLGPYSLMERIVRTYYQ